MKITILYDNTAWDRHLTADWGFSCLVEAHGQKILFDAGAKGDILLNNMQIIGIDPCQLDFIFISHDHWDHTGGLEDILQKIKIPVYVPVSFNSLNNAGSMIRISHARKINDNIYSTGELNHMEQSLVLRIGGEVVVVTGCSHPGVKEIIRAASSFGPVAALVGGLHGFNDFDLIDHLKQICPTHCTQYIQEIAARYPDKYIPGGAGKTISV